MADGFSIRVAAVADRMHRNSARLAADADAQGLTAQAAILRAVAQSLRLLAVRAAGAAPLDPVLTAEQLARCAKAVGDTAPLLEPHDEALGRRAEKIAAKLTDLALGAVP